MASAKPTRKASARPKVNQTSSKPSSSDTTARRSFTSKNLSNKELKTKPKPTVPDKHKKKRRQYTEAELGIPKLNMITPAGVRKASGKKRGKTFVDDPETMQTILAMVHAEKEGQIESKMLRARKLEEVREARAREAESKERGKREALEEKKDEIRQRKKRGKKGKKMADALTPTDEDTPIAAKPKKRVTFG